MQWSCQEHIDDACKFVCNSTSLSRFIAQALSHLLVTIINSSFLSAVFPNQLKQSLIIPIIKDSSIESNQLSNYRPIANLPFLSKMIEKLVYSELKNYLSSNFLYPRMQSAYRKFHSTETALVKLFNGVACSIDAGEEVALVLLDLSSAYDTIDHVCLIDRLERRFEISSKVLTWIESYLSQREQVVSINGASSK